MILLRTSDRSADETRESGVGVGVSRDRNGGRERSALETVLRPDVAGIPVDRRFRQDRIEIIAGTGDLGEVSCVHGELVGVRLEESPPGHRPPRDGAIPVKLVIDGPRFFELAPRPREEAQPVVDGVVRGIRDTGHVATVADHGQLAEHCDEVGD